jgi:hypothetical protein
LKTYLLLFGLGFVEEVFHRGLLIHGLGILDFPLFRETFSFVVGILAIVIIVLTFIVEYFAAVLDVTVAVYGKNRELIAGLL